MWMRTGGVRTRSNLYEDCVTVKKNAWDEQFIKIESLFGRLTFFRSFTLGLCQGNNTMKGKVRMVEAAREKRRNKDLTTSFIPRLTQRFPVDPRDFKVPPPSSRATQGTKPLRAGLLGNSQGGFWYWKRNSNLHLLCLKHTLPSELSTRF